MRSEAYRPKVSFFVQKKMNRRLFCTGKLLKKYLATIIFCSKLGLVVNRSLPLVTHSGDQWRQHVVVVVVFPMIITQAKQVIFKNLS